MKLSVISKEEKTTRAWRHKPPVMFFFFLIEQHSIGDGYFWPEKPQWLPNILFNFCLYVIPGASRLTLQQPPIITATLGHDVTMPCHIPHQEDAITSTILYWAKLNEGTETSLLSESEGYHKPVKRLDNDQHSANLSMLLKAVQWADSGKYLCKLSIRSERTNKRYRAKGNTTLLLIHGKYENWWDGFKVCQVQVRHGLQTKFLVFRSLDIMQVQG